MENSSTIQATLNEWLQLTIDHPLYVTAIAIIVWLLTAVLYSFRIASLSKQNTAIEKQRNSAETNLNNSEQQRQQLQIELQQSIENEKQRALNAEQQLAQRNQQIAAIIQKLAKNVDFGETPIPFTSDLKADQLWQQHDKATNYLLETLREQQLANNELQKFYQAEKDKVAIIEARLQTLQANLQNQNTSLPQDLTVAAPVENKLVIDTNSEKLKNLFKKPEIKQEEPIAPQTTTETTVTDVLVKVTEDKPVAEEKPIPEIIAEQKPEIISKVSTVNQEISNKVDETQPKPVVEPPVIKQTITDTTGLEQIQTNKTEIAPKPKPRPQPTKPVMQNRPKTQYHASDIKLSKDVPSSRIEDMADNLTETVNKFKKLFSRSE